ncbi:phosphopantetheine-binding protein [Polyangium aurulentum]|uniref:phosphopantetheine-binding protein n=1 Tax=Polyangium aurulentum TaxID=2567896 RepID=UPI0010AE7381|nr:phosphopantetheine-binding protein [Polyangium aurulentum]UQA57016.1 acyl carrier protein [Polyangium aurulentum]
MNRQEILDVVLKHLRQNVDGLEGREIDPSRPMADFGASSLDIVEVVSSSIRELRIKVPRTELVGLKNINELVDLFVKKSQ